MKKIDAAAALLAIYAGIVWFAFLYLDVAYSGLIAILITILVMGMTYVLLIPVLCFERRVNLKPETPRAHMGAIISVITFLGVLFIMMVWLFAYLPGLFSSDSIQQYTQAIEGNYNDWHPVWHTLIVFTLPLKLFGKPVAILVVQMIWFALCLAYMTKAIFGIAGLKAAVVSVLYIVLNPYTGYIVLYPWKDVAFGVAGLFCIVFAVKVALKQVDAQSIWNLLAFSLACTSATLFRHNAILFTFPLIIVLLFHMKRKDWVKLVVFTMASIVLIKGPLYRALDVSKPDRRILETTGLPLTVIGNVAK